MFGSKGANDLEKTLLKVTGINKTFFETQVLHSIDFDVREGEVHILLGENGAGKSTLMKILSGEYTMDTGSIYINGEKVQIRSPLDSIACGIGMVYQELSLAPNLSVVENIFLGKLPTKNGFVDWKSAERKTREIFESIGIDIDVTRNVSTFDLGMQQLTEIMRVLNQNAKLIILDEPTSSLSSAEVDKLFDAIRKLKKKGVSCIYITHKLHEVFQIGDRLTVLRDGCKIGETIEDLSTITQEDLVTAVVGRQLKNRYPKEVSLTDEILMEVEGLTDQKNYFDISFQLHKGEVLGIGGLVGSGCSEMLDGLFGVTKPRAGQIKLFGKPYQCENTKQAVRSNIGLLTKDRRDGLLTHMSLVDNIVISRPEKFAKYGFRKKKAEREAGTSYVEKLNVATDSIFKKVRNLSGGNQQKVAIAKWLCGGTTIYLMDDPTRGIDVGSKVEVYKIINQLTAQGAGIIMISSDMPELLGMSDRIIVMRKGHITAYEEASACTQEFILEKAAGN